MAVGILNGIVEQVHERRLDLAAVARDLYRIGRFAVPDRPVVQVVTRTYQRYRFTQQPAEIELLDVHPAVLLPRAAGLQYLFDRSKQPVAIRQHDVVKLTPLLVR